MKRILVSLNVVAAAATCVCGANASSTSSPSDSGVSGSQADQNAAQVANVKSEFGVSSRAQGLAGDVTIHRRGPGYRFAAGRVAKLTFVKSNSQQSAERLKVAARKFFAALQSSASQNPQLKNGSSLMQLDMGDDSAIAFTIPESGSISLYRRAPWKDETPIQDASEAVSVALNSIADNQLLNLAAGETLDVVGIHARFLGTSDETTVSSKKVGYKVMFGRRYNGIPILGPTTTVGLDSSGKLAFFHRGWREIVNASGQMDVASEDEIDSRRDPLMVRFLNEDDATCGYVEDEHPRAVQDGPGIGCHYTYSDPNATDDLSRRVVDWVNASQDESVPMNGVLSGEQ